jgi:2-polyprenyl-3-methyl-5-hydroxy-6-metoxy-1,4-benzoquinol methylase
MIPYRLKVALLKRRWINVRWRYRRARQGQDVGSYERLPDLVRRYAPGKSFADIGCMWGVDGRYSFLAEESGATAVKALDVFGPTPEFEEEKRHRSSRVEFILGDVTDPKIVRALSPVDVVFCAGVLYHHPSPFELLVALRSMCKETLILRTSTIPEIKGLQNAAVYFPMLSEKQRQLWNLKSLGISYQAGISEAFDPGQGYGNWFWGMTPSCLESLLHTAGFRTVHRMPEAFAQTLVCEPVEPPLQQETPSEEEAAEIAREMSKATNFRPA